jgi:predicted nucleic acid-binding protein
MIQVVADATLLRYLIEIQAIDMLPRLFGRIITPPAVIQELQHTNTPPLVRIWIASPPPWVVVQAPSSAADPALSRLGAGGARGDIARARTPTSIFGNR